MDGAQGPRSTQTGLGRRQGMVQDMKWIGFPIRAGIWAIVCVFVIPYAVIFDPESLRQKEIESNPGIIMKKIWKGWVIQ